MFFFKPKKQAKKTYLKKTSFVFFLFTSLYVIQYFQRMGDYSQLWEKQKNVGADLNAN